MTAGPRAYRAAVGAVARNPKQMGTPGRRASMVVEPENGQLQSEFLDPRSIVPCDGPNPTCLARGADVCASRPSPAPGEDYGVLVQIA